MLYRAAAIVVVILASLGIIAGHLVHPAGAVTLSGKINDGSRLILLDPKLLDPKSENLFHGVSKITNVTGGKGKVVLRLPNANLCESDNDCEGHKLYDYLQANGIAVASDDGSSPIRNSQLPNCQINLYLVSALDTQLLTTLVLDWERMHIVKPAIFFSYKIVHLSVIKD